MIQNPTLRDLALWCAFAFLLIIYSCSTSRTGGQAAGKNTYTLQSPDSKIAVNFRISDDQRAFYSISRNDTLVLQESKLGVLMEDADFTQGLKLSSASKAEQVQDNYEILTSKRRKNNYSARRQTFHLTNAAGQKVDIIFQVSNDGVAFRYYFPGATADKKKISNEITSFKMQEGARAWLQPMADAKTSWARTNPSYEEHYQKDIPVGTASPIKGGWVYPALFKSGNSWVLITETFPEKGDYCGTRLHQLSPNGEYSIDFPQEAEKMTGGALNPESVLPWYTPWRIVAVGTLKTIVESTLGTDVATPAVNMNTAFVNPGKASWSWVLLKDDSTTFAVQKRFIDYAADMKWEHCLIDANWDKTIGYDKIKELADYGKSKNVSLHLWYNSNGNWNDAPQTPLHLMTTHEARMKEFGRLQEMGIRGVKIDFFGGDGQSFMQYYTDILKDAAANKIMINFHGCTLPRGLQRTYPNLMTMEAIKGFEFITFGQRDANEAPSHAAMLPFTRNAFDPMDFTPVSLHVVPRINRKTTVGNELAQSVLFISGIQHYTETDRGMKQVPPYVKTFLQNVPAVWDDSRFIDGFPGKLAVIARKSGDKWYVAGINGEATAKKVQLDLSFLGKKKGQSITDGSEHNSFQQNTIDLAASNKQEVTLQPNGGFVMVF